jgi:hypothetical protein
VTSFQLSHMRLSARQANLPSMHRPPQPMKFTTPPKHEALEQRQAKSTGQGSIFSLMTAEAGIAVPVRPRLKDGDRSWRRSGNSASLDASRLREERRATFESRMKWITSGLILRHIWIYRASARRLLQDAGQARSERSVTQTYESMYKNGI